MPPVVTDALDYYARHGCALFPIPKGAKSPTGIVTSWKHDHSSDPATWQAWRTAHPDCNFGLVASASRLVIVDVDVSEIGRDAAWALWCEWCASAGVPVPAPHVQSARGGWHFLFALPPDVDPATLTQRRLAPHIDTRVEGFVVAAGSYYDGTGRGEASGHYILLTDAPPHQAPAALLSHLTRAAPTERATKPGDRDKDDVAALIEWLAERDAFASYEDWCAAGMALKLEYGDDGLDLWELTHDETVTPELAASKWQSFASEPSKDSVTIASLLLRAHNLGWRGQVRKAAGSMFADAVAALAASSGASLPRPAGGVPMLQGEAELTRICTPRLESFLTAHDMPSRPQRPDYPTLPESANGHGLYDLLRQSIDRIIAYTENGPKGYQAIRILDPLAVLYATNKDVHDAVAGKIRSFGCVPPARVKILADDLADRVSRAFVPEDEWIRDSKGEIEHDNSDNLPVFLAKIGAELRFNVWWDRVEIKGYKWHDWTNRDDSVMAQLAMRARRTGTRYRPSKDYFWDATLSLARENPIDPAVDRLAVLQSAWDGQPRLSIWLTATCGVPCDPYHQAVGRSIIGGMVRRIRNPGCKFDECAVLIGPQGFQKSELCRLLSPDEAWFSDSIKLGEASKELVLLLAGKAIVEIPEMSKRTKDVDDIKHMITTQSDMGRPAYARTPEERPRRNIFICTTNAHTPLTDNTGNRRFLPVRVNQMIDKNWLAANIDQLIGEAATLEAAGETFRLPESVWATATEHQEAARAESDMEIQLIDWFAETDAIGSMSYITAKDLSRLSDLARWREGPPARAVIMRRMLFRDEIVRVDGKKIRAWVRGEQPARVIVERGVRYSIGMDSSGGPRISVGRSTGA